MNNKMENINSKNNIQCNDEINNNLISENKRNSIKENKMKEEKEINSNNKRINEYYEFNINNNKLNEKYEYNNNFITTTKYNILTFVPKSFLLQFTRLPNVYFLIIAIIQSIPLISPLSGASAIIPLLFVLLVSMIRELLEDIQRFKYDKINNEEEVIVYRNNFLEKTKSESLRVGEIILIKNNNQVPCDCLLLFSSLEEGNCYLETSSLDGEKTLKEKEGNKIIINKIREFNINLNLDNIQLINLNDISGFIQCDFPNPDFHKFDGKIKLNINNEEINENYLPLTINQMLYKGAFLKNTDWVFAIVLYTGLKNKIILNSEKPRMKLSQIENRMSNFLIWIFSVQIFLCILCSIMNKIAYDNHKKFYLNFIKYERSPSLESFIAFFSYILLLNTLIPISLIVTLEIVKVIQGFFINWDTDLYSFKYKKFCFAKSVSINEELGNVNYIFSDKTGTLTCNKMEFKYCIIGETCYQYKDKEENGIVDDEESQYKNNDNIKLYGKNKKIIDSNYINNENNNIKNSTNYKTVIPNKNYRIKYKQIGRHYFDSLLQSEKKNMTEQQKNEFKLIREFWTAISCAHECICSNNESEEKYTGISPDDVELVKAASFQGFSFMKSNKQIRKINICSEEVEFQILNILNFTSDRKRMSIIVKDYNNVIKLYCKGADSEIKKRINYNNNKTINTICKSVDKFSSKGYRTLMIAMKIISEKNYNLWKKKLDEAEVNLNDKSTLIDKCYDEIENNLNLIGATIVEDKLQDKVPETIRDLRLAGIKIWVLTGDKIDTAENIALSCNLISSNYKNFKIKTLNKEESKGKIDEIELFFKEFQEYTNQELKNIQSNEQIILNEDNKYFKKNVTKNNNNTNIINNNTINNNINNNNNSESKSSITPFSILIESPILSKIMLNSEITNKFLKIGLVASTVICCRVSPLQKSRVVKMVKNYNKEIITLAIGDGGNDVSMIMEAHIGIGLYGQEGMRAVQASDFSIGEFKFLRKLLFFHGRINLIRIRKMILYFFYKNFVFTMVQFYFAFESLFSGQTIMDDWFISCFNLVFTSVPLIIQALSDFDICENDSDLIKEMMPFIYKENYLKSDFNLFSFSIILMKGIIISIINYIIVVLNVKNGIIGKNGDVQNLWCNSYFLYCNIIFSVSFSLLVDCYNIIWPLPLIMFFTSFVLFFVFCLIENYQVSFNSFGAIENSMKHLKFYFIFLLFCFIVFIIDYSIICCKSIFSESITSILKNIKFKSYRKDTLPKIILDAKIDIELINKYNNYNMIKSNSETFSLYQLIQSHFNCQLVPYRKSRTFIFKNESYKTLNNNTSRSPRKLNLNSAIKNMEKNKKNNTENEDNSSASIVNL